MSSIRRVIVPLCNVDSPHGPIGVVSSGLLPGGNPFTLHELNVIRVGHFHQITRTVLKVEHNVLAMEVLPTPGMES